MSSWYYVDGGQNRQGPVSAEALAEAWRLGLVGLDSLVWREGLSEWVPLRQFHGELGLASVVPVAPPLPPMAAPPTMVPAKKGNGCLIAAIVIVGGGVLLIPILAILAAIALPAYQDYIARSQTTTGLADIRGGITAFEELIQRDPGTPATPGEIGLPDNTARCSRIEVQGSFDLESAGQSISCTLQGNPKVSGAVISLARNELGAWDCTVTGTEAKYVPTGCSTH